MDAKLLRNGVIVILLVVIYFYGLDHFIMGIQGLPLNLDLSPAQ